MCFYSLHLKSQYKQYFSYGLQASLTGYNWAKEAYTVLSTKESTLTPAILYRFVEDILLYRLLPNTPLNQVCRQHCLPKAFTPLTNYQLISETKLALLRFAIEAAILAAGILLESKKRKFESGEYKKPKNLDPGFDIIHSNVNMN